MHRFLEWYKATYMADLHKLMQTDYSHVWELMETKEDERWKALRLVRKKPPA